MPVKISLYHMSNKLGEFEVSDFPLIIGRSPGADITIEDCWVSRQHCEITERDGVLQVRDLASKHGTRLNDDYISQGKFGVGDRLSVGLSTLVAEPVGTQPEVEVATN